MKAVIMAGGKGTRLRPITENIPKPLLPVAGVACIKRILSLLNKHGITDVAVTLGYLSEKIENELGKEYDGVKITYIKEKAPLGTAGGVRGCSDFIKGEDFIVISGDAVCETDLSAAIKFREEKDALLTMVLTRASDPGEYGVVLFNDGGDITEFCEKPSVSSTYSDTVNTGIYVMSNKIFSFIPSGESDFARDIFPLLLSNGEKLTAIVDDNYWCDIGDFHSYRMANLKYQNGGNVIGSDCDIQNENTVGTVFLDRVKVGHGTKIENSIICSDTVIGENCFIGENCVIGAGSIIGHGVVLCEGTVLDCGSIVADGSFLRTGASVSRSALSSMLDGKGIFCSVRRMSPSFCMKLGSAMTEAVGFGRIGIMTDGEPDSSRITSALLRGIGAVGGESVILGEGFEAASCYASSAMSLDLSLFIRCRDDECMISFFDENGLYPKREFERALLQGIGSQKAAEMPSTPKRSSCDFVNEYYLPMLTRNRCALDHMKVSVKNENPSSSLLKRALLNIGADIGKDGISFSVSDDGFDLRAEQDGFICDDPHIKALLLKYMIRDNVSLPVSTPSALVDLCHRKAELYTHCPSGNDEDEVRKNAKNKPELIHACAAAAEIAALISVSGKTLKELCEHLPKFAVSSYDYKTKDRSHFTILPHLGSPSGDGIVSEYEKGSVRVIPSRDGYHLISEAASGEYAEELISLSEKEIKRLLQKMRKD